MTDLNVAYVIVDFVHAEVSPNKKKAAPETVEDIQSRQRGASKPLISWLFLTAEDDGGEEEKCRRARVTLLIFPKSTEEASSNAQNAEQKSLPTTQQKPLTRS